MCLGLIFCLDSSTLRTDMKLSLRDFFFSDWLCLIGSALCIAKALQTCNLLWAGCALILGGLFLFVPYARKKNNERFRHRIQQETEAQCRLYDEKEAELHARLAAGELSVLVQWWEEDEFFLDENEHILFVFADGEEMDFVVHLPTAQKVKPLLAAFGIEWEKRFMLHFDSHILYPPHRAGQKYNSEN